MDMQSRAAGDAPRAAIYCRLSEEDADKADPGQDSRSIQNQKSMLVRYAVEQGWQIYNIYSDDDYTGSDRERPQFNRLLEDARRGCFDIVLCKSQSRFTREMELVEKYIHGLFVEWSVRFVGYADNADTANRGNKKARQINGLVNEWYLEDMSQNIRTVLDAKRRQGEFVAALPLTDTGRTRRTNTACLWTSRRRRWCGASMRCTFPAGALHALRHSSTGNRCRIPAHTKSRTTRLSTGAAPPRWQSFGAIPRCWAS
jgi:DNA invertase Pin-like site-specific DNA recombinase